MRDRGSVVLIENSKVGLIQRIRDGTVYNDDGTTYNKTYTRIDLRKLLS